MPEAASQIARRCLNCGASESQRIPLVNRRYESLTVFVCQDVRACSARFLENRSEGWDNSASADIQIIRRTN